MPKKSKEKDYWKENIRYVIILLSIWFLSSYGAGILFKQELDLIKIGGFKLFMGFFKTFNI